MFCIIAKLLPGPDENASTPLLSCSKQTSLEARHCSGLSSGTYHQMKDRRVISVSF